MTTRLWNNRSLAFALAAAFAAGACSDSSPVTDVSQDQDDRPLLKTVLGPGNVVLPGGTVDLSETRIQDFDFNVSDGFSRSETPLGGFLSIETSFGPAMGFRVGSAVRNSSNDLRLPALTDDDATQGDFWGLFNPAWCCGVEGWWDLFGEVTGLKPETKYTVVLARMSLQVNGELDQQQILTGRPVDQPDQLSMMPGEMTAYVGVTCDFSVPTPVTADMNPVVLGEVETNGDGNVTVDCIPVASGNSPWWRSVSAETPPGAADSLAFGLNQVGATLQPGQFNYVLLYEGAPTDATPIPSSNPAIRAQVGPDVNSSGVVLNNALRPFPTAITDLATFTSLPGGANAFAAPGKITLDLSGLPAIGGYQVQLFDRGSGAFTPVGGSFASEGSGDAITVELDSESGADFGANSHVAVTMSGADTEFLFAEYLGADKSLIEGGLTFGGFDGADDTSQFLVSGSGLGEFFGDSLFVRLTRLSTELPDGFHYQSYLTTTDGGMVRLHTVELDEIGNGLDAIHVSEAGGNFGNFNFYVLVLEPDGANLLTDMEIQISEDYFGKFSDFFTR